jgi:hypothetical protein
VYKGSSNRRAALASGTNRAKQNTPNNQIHIGVGHYNCGIITT